VVDKKIDIEVIEVDIVGNCNMNCWFCAPGLKWRWQKGKEMDIKTYIEVIKSIPSDYNKQFSFCGHGESLLHSQFVDILKFTKEHLPKAAISIWTNGILLSEEMFNLISPFLDEIIFDDYNVKQHERIKKIAMTQDRGSIIYRIAHNDDINYNTRAGNIAEIVKKKPRSTVAPCWKPSKHLFLSTEGYWIICCHDYGHDWKLKGKSFTEVVEYLESSERIKELINKTRKNQRPCEDCYMGDINNPELLGVKGERLCQEV